MSEVKVDVFRDYEEANSDMEWKLDEAVDAAREALNDASQIADRATDLLDKLRADEEAAGEDVERYQDMIEQLESLEGIASDVEKISRELRNLEERF